MVLALPRPLRMDALRGRAVKGTEKAIVSSRAVRGGEKERERDYNHS